MFVSLLRIIKFALQNFRRNFWLSVATISIIILTLISVSFLGFLNILTSEAIESVKERIDISVRFKPEVTPLEVKAIKDRLSEREEIKLVRYISREEALATFQERHKDDIWITHSLQELDRNPLGDSIVIKAYDISFYPLILQALEASQYKDLIQENIYQDNRAFLEKIHIITDKIKTIALFITIVFSLISVLIIFNTVRIAIYTHSEEISIMKLVGSDNWFIRAPFLVEALMYACIGTVLTLVILYPLVKIVDPYVLSFFDQGFSITAYYTSNIIRFALWQFGGMLFLTLVASFLAVGRYLNV